VKIEKLIAKKLTETGKSISIAESCTGGLLSHRITNIPGSSQFMKLGLITYSNLSKFKLLRVPQKILRQYGAVSKPTAQIMAQHVRKILHTNFGIAITGIAGPTGHTKSKPLGLTFIAISSRSKTVWKKFIFKGSRLSVKAQAADAACRLLLSMLKNE